MISPKVIVNRKLPEVSVEKVTGEKDVLPYYHRNYYVITIADNEVIKIGYRYDDDGIARGFIYDDIRHNKLDSDNYRREDSIRKRYSAVHYNNDDDIMLRNIVRMYVITTVTDYSVFYTYNECTKLPGVQANPDNPCHRHTDVHGVYIQTKTRLVDEDSRTGYAKYAHYAVVNYDNITLLTSIMITNSYRRSPIPKSSVTVNAYATDNVIPLSKLLTAKRKRDVVDFITVEVNRRKRVRLL